MLREILNLSLFKSLSSLFLHKMIPAGSISQNYTWVLIPAMRLKILNFNSSVLLSNSNKYWKWESFILWHCKLNAFWCVPRIYLFKESNSIEGNNKSVLLILRINWVLTGNFNLTYHKYDSHCMEMIRELNHLSVNICAFYGYNNVNYLSHLA